MEFYTELSKARANGKSRTIRGLRREGSLRAARTGDRMPARAPNKAWHWLLTKEAGFPDEARAQIIAGYPAEQEADSRGSHCRGSGAAGHFWSGGLGAGSFPVAGGCDHGRGDSSDLGWGAAGGGIRSAGGKGTLEFY